MAQRPPLNLTSLASAAGPVSNPVDVALAERAARKTPADQQAKPRAAALVQTPATDDWQQQRSRAGKKQISGFFSDEKRRALKSLAAEQGTSIEEMLSQAIDDLFVKYGKKPVA